MTTLDWVTIALYFGLLAGLTWWSVARSRNTADDYFLAGRDLGWVVVGASIFASNIGSEHLVGLAGAGATSGVALAHYELHAWCLLVLGWVLVPFYLRSRVYTMPEFLELRFSATTERGRLHSAAYGLNLDWPLTWRIVAAQSDAGTGLIVEFATGRVLREDYETERGAVSLVVQAQFVPSGHDRSYPGIEAPMSLRPGGAVRRCRGRHPLSNREQCAPNSLLNCFFGIPLRALASCVGRQFVTGSAPNERRGQPGAS